MQARKSQGERERERERLENSTIRKSEKKRKTGFSAVKWVNYT